MAAVRSQSQQLKRHAAIQQRARRVPRDGELPDRPAVPFAPASQAFERGAAVGDFIRDIELIHRPFPKAAQRSYRRRRAVVFVLRHEGHVELNATRRRSRGLGRFRPGGELERIRIAQLSRRRDRRRDLAATPCKARPAGQQPLTV